MQSRIIPLKRARESAKYSEELLRQAYHRWAMQIYIPSQDLLISNPIITQHTQKDVETKTSRLK